MVKIRLARKGRKDKAQYHIVAIDSRIKREGKPLEHLGHYDPQTAPPTIHLKREAILAWLAKGAQVTRTVRNILSSRGIMLEHHLQQGMAKGRITEAMAEEKLADWQKAHHARKEIRYHDRTPVTTRTATQAAPLTASEAAPAAAAPAA